MQYEERTAIDTPEGVSLDFPLAGIGSRFSAAALDLMVQLSLLGCALLVLSFLSGVFEAAGVGVGFAIALAAVIVFLAVYGYDIVFLTWRAGQTPGKEVIGIRVVREGGRPVDFKAATIRTLVGLIDGWGTAFIVGAVSIVASPRNQRLGDMAAGTLVIRERTGADRESPPPPPPGFAAAAPPPPAEESALIDLGAVSDSDLATVRQFLERRAKLDPGARARLAEQIAAGLRPLVAGVPEGGSDEDLLETIASAAAARR